MHPPEDTIVALSSAGGPAARAILRLTGDQAFSIAATAFTPGQGDPSLAAAPSWTRLAGRCRLDDAATVPCHAYLFRAPRSYTAQDLVELHLPGSPPLVQMVIDRLLAAGARLAQPGEFTARAFFNGRIDLTQAQAVAQIINARSDDQLRAAQRLLDGALHRTCRRITEKIAETLALAEADIDFSDEDIELASPAQLDDQLRDAIAGLDNLLRDCVRWERLEHLPQVVLAGPANAGKSTLLNALLQTDRSITSPIAGTTRDLLTAPLHLKSGTCLLIDTAGLGPIEDPLAHQTQRLSRQALSQADLIIYVCDASKDLCPPDLDDIQALAHRPAVIPVANKIDLLGDHGATTTQELSRLFDAPAIGLSALHADNLDALEQRLDHQLHLNPTTTFAQAIALTNRQHRDLKSGLAHLRQAQEMVASSQSCQIELFALELREALNDLGAVSGQILPNDILTLIFNKFCIGK